MLVFILAKICRTVYIRRSPGSGRCSHSSRPTRARRTCCVTTSAKISRNHSARSRRPQLPPPRRWRVGSPHGAVLARDAPGARPRVPLHFGGRSHLLGRLGPAHNVESSSTSATAAARAGHSRLGSEWPRCALCASPSKRTPAEVYCRAPPREVRGAWSLHVRAAQSPAEGSAVDGPDVV